MNTPIADMVAEMLKNCIPNEMIVLAVRTTELALAPTSTRHQVDDPLEKRRAWDREYRRRQRESTRHPPDIHPTSDDSASLLREDKKLSEVVIKKESKKERGHKLPPDWAPNEDHYRNGMLRGMGKGAVDDLAVTLRLWCATNANRATTTRANWDSFFTSWIRREKINGNGTSNHRADPATGRATAREAHHVATMGGAALRSLRESKSAGAGRVSSNDPGIALGPNPDQGTENAH